MKTRGLIIGVVAVLAVVAAGVLYVRFGRVQPTAGNVSFAGKTVTVLVNFGVGGATDIFARSLVPYLEKYIPGKPTIVVQNNPAAGGIQGANWLYSAAKKDGTVIGVFTSPFATQVLERTEYDSRNFYWLGGVAESSVAYFHRNLGITKPEEFPNARATPVVGGFGPSNSKDLSQRTFFEILGVKYRYVTGYASNAELLSATLRGEINFSQVSLTSWFTSFQEHLKNGTLLPAVQTGLLDASGNIVRDPRVADIPTAAEVAEKIKGPSAKNTITWRAQYLINAFQGAVLRAIVLPPGVPQAVGETLRQAVAKVFADPEFVAASRKQQGFEYVFIPGPQAQELARRVIDSADGEVVQYLVKLQQQRP